MPLHHFIATPIAKSPVYDKLMAHVQAQSDSSDDKDAVQKIEIPFEKFYGIGTFPVNTTDELYRDAIIKACRELYDFDLTPYYYPNVEGSDSSNDKKQHLFDVTDLTASKSQMHRQSFKRDMHKLREHNRNSHSSYFYIFIRPVQILVIAGLLGYALYLAALYEYGNAFPEDEPQESQEDHGGRGGRGGDDYGY